MATDEEILNRVADFHCNHNRVYVLDDGLVSGIMKLRCQDCPREFAKDVGKATRRPAAETIEMWCNEERVLRPHRQLRRSRFGVSKWACESCGATRSKVTPT